YFASKAYVLALSEALSREFRPLGVKFTCVCPGPVPTGFQARAGLDENLSPLLARSTERVARDAYDGFMRRKRLVVPGFAKQGHGRRAAVPATRPGALGGRDLPSETCAAKADERIEW